MFTIQTLDNISPKGLKLFDKNLFYISPDAIHSDALLLRSYKLHNYAFPEQLKAVARAGAGVDNIPVDQLTQMGIPVFYAPGANANAVKELVMAAMLMGYRHLGETSTFINELIKNDNLELNQQIESKKKQFVGHEIFGKTLGVIGLGNIGVKVANAGIGLGMNVIGYDPNMTLNNALALLPNVEQAMSLNILLEHSDIITLHIPLTPETTYLINENNISLLKPHALLLNFSREKIVSEEAILQQLNKQQTMHYITDFPTRNLTNAPNVLSFPHLGASTIEAEQYSAEMVIRNLCNYLQYGTIEYSVNFPNISLSMLGKLNCYRFLIANKNIPGMVGRVTQEISKLGYNIEQMENKSRGELAVNLIDITGPQTSLAKLNKELNHIPGVIKITPIVGFSTHNM